MSRVIVLVLLLGSCTTQFDANKFAQDHLIIDTHIDIPYRLKAQLDETGEFENIGESTSFDFDYPRAVAGGLNVPFFSIYLPASTETDGTSFEVANQLIGIVNDVIKENNDKYFLLDQSTYLGNLPGQNLVGIALGMENGAPIEGQLDRVRYFYDKGIRYITLAHSESNHISDSSYDENKRWKGLSPFGKELIVEMNNVGMMIDISHVSDDAFMQVLEISKTPVIASHSSLRHFTPGWERNVSDEMLTKLAVNGGVLQINFGSSFIIDKARTNDANPSEDYNFATLEQVVDHFDRAVSLAGIDHVGIGSDYDGVGDTLPIGLKDVSQFPNLIEELYKRGYSRSDIAKILGGNTARVWREVEVYAKNQSNR